MHVFARLIWDVGVQVDQVDSDDFGYSGLEDLGH